ncbi:MAG: ECF transporter S component [Lachnospiraceae bacterium]|nr:ECF transporter S component [Lachnospiraceae bacterium]
MKEQGKFGTRQITLTAALLAICIISQFFKNLSIFITGPIINTCIVLTVFLVNLPCAIILSIITPLTAFLITASPVMKAVPGIIPLIMCGNIVLAVTVHFLMKKEVLQGGRLAGGWKSWVKAVVCALAKGAFMGLTISLWLLPTFLPEKMRPKLSVFQTTFSLHQFLTALIGFVYVFLIWAALRTAMKGPKGPVEEA